MFQLFYKPQPVSRIFIESWNLYRSTFLKFFPLVVLYGIVGVLGDTFSLRMIGTRERILWTDFGLALSCNIMMLYLFLFLLYSVNQVLLDEKLDYPKNFLFIIRKLPIGLAVCMLSFVISLAGFILLIYPGIFLSVLFLFSLLGVILDNDSVISALKHSARLVQHHWWRTFLFLTILAAGFFMLRILPKVIIQEIVQIITLFGHPVTMKGMPYVTRIVTQLFFAAYIFWIISLMVVQYYDLKLRYQPPAT